jgi:hypothetical protein
MLTTLLTSDSIPHRMFPVEGYAELEARTQDLERDSEVRLLLLMARPVPSSSSRDEISRVILIAPIVLVLSYTP